MRPSKLSSAATLMTLMLLILLPSVVVAAASPEDWVEGSLFFHTRDHSVLDAALASGVPLSRDDVAERCGLRSEEIRSMVSIVESLGGRVDRVSQLRDWMHVSFPSSLGEGKPSSQPRSCPFLHASLSSKGDERHDNIVHHLTSSLQQADMEHVAAHLMLVGSSAAQGQGVRGGEDVEAISTVSSSATTHPSSASKYPSSDDGMASSGRQLRQAGAAKKNVDQVYTYQNTKTWPLFVANESEAMKNLGAWYTGYAVMVQCPGKTEPFMEGVGTASCLLNYTVTLRPLLVGGAQLSAGTKTISFEDLASYRKRCDEVPSVCNAFVGSTGASINGSTYVYGFPLYKSAEPNMVYLANQLVTVRQSSSDTSLLSLDLSPGIYNYENASAITLREYYGVDPDLSGSNETIQASTLVVGAADSAVNVTAVNQYLSLLGLEPHSELLISDFGVPNNVSVCNGTSACAETMLDVQALQSFAPNATTYFTPTRSGKDNNGTIQEVLTFLDNLLTADPVASVSSLSWSATYKQQFNISVLESYLQKIAAMGMTLIGSSGDAGASGTSDGCYPPVDGGPLIGNFQGEAWPTVSPWVTAVGGTQFLNLDGQSTEVVCSSATFGGITSGGGFSGAWANISTPSWQQAAVSKYLSENNATTFAGFPTDKTPGWNPQGRGFPDIAMYGARFPILDVSGQLDVVSGTSLSAPLAAAIFSLANQKLLSKGYQKIGYANPMLYWMGENCPSAFNDITIGDNQVGENQVPCLNGFPAAPGWDAVTGLGSIKFDPFVECAMKYQDATLRQDTAASPATSPGSAPSSGHARQALSLLFVYIMVAVTTMA